MGKDLQNVIERKVAEIVQLGDQMILPTGMDLDEAIDLLKRRKEFEDQEVRIEETFDVFPWDGAYALDCALRARFGWVQAIPTETFFGPVPPKMINVEVGPGKRAMVPWGEMTLPNVEGKMATAVGQKNGRFVFKLACIVKRKYENFMRTLFDEVRSYTISSSIYRGKAIKIRFKSDNNEDLKIPEPVFLSTDQIHEGQLIYAEKVEKAVRTNLFTPITRVKDCLANGIAVKRGVLLGGTFGTGKTMAATIASKLAVDVGVTYIYCPRASELAQAIEFAKQYQSPAAVVFCEDIDREVAGDRSVKMDDILNTIDGIDSKNSNIIVILTTNDLDSINPAMLRPGRLDAVIEITPPDAGAVERLIRFYADGAVPEEADLSKAGEALSGNIPAVIAEVVKRAKLSQLTLNAPGEPVRNLSQEALVEAAETMGMQIGLLKKLTEKPAPEDNLSVALRKEVSKAVNGTGEAQQEMHRKVRELHSQIVG